MPRNRVDCTKCKIILWLGVARYYDRLSASTLAPTMLPQTNNAA